MTMTCFPRQKYIEIGIGSADRHVSRSQRQGQDGGDGADDSQMIHRYSFWSADSVEFDDLMAGSTASKATQRLRRQVVPWRDSS